MRSISFWPRFVCVCVCVLRIQAVEPSETRHATLRSRSRRKRIALMVASVVSFTGSDRVSTTGEFRYADNERTNDRTNERTNERTDGKEGNERLKEEREGERKKKGFDLERFIRRCVLERTRVKKRTVERG